MIKGRKALKMKTQNRIDELLSKKSKGILSLYITAGYPKLDDTLPLCLELESAGADLVEIGFPFSDPVADGPVIQESSQMALKNGMCLEVLLKQLEGMRSALKIPVILMGYINPVLQYGFERFCANCREVGVDGLIIPDLPLEEYQKSYGEVIKRSNLHFIFMVSPSTSAERIRIVDSHSTAFIYAVSSRGVTGGRLSADKDRDSYLDSIKNMKLQHPVLCGFGISNRESFENVCIYTAGGIIGTALISRLKASAEPFVEAQGFVNMLSSGSGVVG